MVLVNNSEFYEIATLFLFLISYIVSFSVLFRTETELVGFGILNFVHAGLILYIVNAFTNRVDSIFYLNAGLLLPYVSIFVAGLFYFISLILVNTTLFGLETKFMNTYGTPLHLSANYREMLDSIKTLLVVLFVLPIVIYGIVLKCKPLLDFGFLRALSQPYSSIAFYAFVMILAVVILGLSCRQLVLANRFSKLKNKDLLK